MSEENVNMLIDLNHGLMASKVHLINNKELLKRPSLHRKKYAIYIILYKFQIKDIHN